MFISLDNAIVPSLIPQTAPVSVTGWNSNWIVGGLLGVALLLGWVGMGHGTRRKKKNTGLRKKRK